MDRNPDCAGSRIAREGNQSAPRIVKNVCVMSVKLPQDVMIRMEAVFTGYNACKNLFLDRFCGVDHMMDVKDFRSLRKQIRKEQKDLKARAKDGDVSAYHALFENQFGIRGRHWVMALKDTCMALNSMWSNLASELKQLVRENENLTDDMKALCYYILSVRTLWYQVLHKEELSLTKADTLNKLTGKLTQEQLKHCRNYLRRITRRHKPYPQVKQNRCMLCYEPRP